MENQFKRPSDDKRLQYAKQEENSKEGSETIGKGKSVINKRDEDLIIEENTIYEIDRDCYERLKKGKKRK